MKTMANKFCDSQVETDNDISSFLKSKDFDHLIETRVQLKGQSKPDNILFIDGSYAYVDNGQYRHTLTEYDFFESHLSYMNLRLLTYLERNQKSPPFLNALLKTVNQQWILFQY